MKLIISSFFIVILGCNVYKKSKIPGVKPYQPIGCNLSEAIKVADTNFYSYYHERKYKRIAENDSEWATFFKPDTSCFIILLLPICNCSDGEVTFRISRENCKIIKGEAGE